jgi:hypothetical protein
MFEIEVLKNAFERHKDEVNKQFRILHNEEEHAVA